MKALLASLLYGLLSTLEKPLEVLKAYYHLEAKRATCEINKLSEKNRKTTDHLIIH